MKNVQLNNDTINIIIGCGGTGIKTLKNLNKQFSQDELWAPHLSQNVFYVVVDTDQAEISSFEEEIELQMGDHTQPFVESIILSAGFQSLVPLVCDNFPKRDELVSEKKERLIDHWWFNENGVPFLAEDVSPLSRGAGQCPPVSYFLSWYNMESRIRPVLQNAVNSLLMSAGQTLTKLDPSSNLNFIIVGGSAGGTGRGCWNLMAYAMREILMKQCNGFPKPVLIYYDSSAFQDVIKDEPQQEKQMQFNSLTGFSELSCWIENKNQADRVIYRLPSMFDPHEEEHDVVDMQLDLRHDTRGGSAPVDNAYIICGRAEGGALIQESDHLYDMVGTALYVLITKSNIARKQINDNATKPFMGLGSSRFEVDTSGIRTFLEKEAQRVYLQRMFDDPARENRGKAFSEEFLKALGLFIPNLQNNLLNLYIPKEGGNLMQIYLSEIMKQYSPSLRKLNQSMCDDDVDEVEKLVKILSKRRQNLPIQTAKGIVVEQFDLIEKSLNKRLADFIELYTSPINSNKDRETATITEIKIFLSELDASLQKLKDSLPDTCPQPENLKDPEKLEKKHRDREYLITGIRYNKTERNEIEQAVKIQIQYLHYQDIKELLTDVSTKLQDVLKKHNVKLSVVEKALNRVLRNGKFDTKTLDSLFKDHFVNPENILRTLTADKYSADIESVEEYFTSGKNYIQKKLLPVMTRDDLESLLKNNLITKNDFWNSVDKVVKKVFESEYLPDLTRDEMTIVEEVSKEVREIVAKSVSLRKDIMIQFALDRVISDHRRYWLTYLNSLSGTDAMQKRVINAFRVFYGVNPEISSEGNITLPLVSEMLEKMAATLCRTCKPYWQIKEKSGYTVNLFYPRMVENTSTFADKLLGMMPSNSDLRISIVGYNEKKNDVYVNNFQMVAVCLQPAEKLDDIRSIQYYNDSPTLLETLRYAESPNGTTVFPSLGEARKYDIIQKPMGFTSPYYVRNEQLANLRWRPWKIAETRDIVEEREDMAKNILVYVFMHFDEGNPMKQRAGEKGFHFPLMVHKKSQHYGFTRQSYKWGPDRITVMENTRTPWYDDTPVCQGLDNLYGALSFQSNIQISNDFRSNQTEWIEWILAEKRLFWNETAPKIGLTSECAEYSALKDHMIDYFSNLKRDAAKKEDKDIWSNLADFVSTKGLIQDD